MRIFAIVLMLTASAACAQTEQDAQSHSQSQADPSASASASSATPSPAAPCQTEQHRQFDFWIGEWTVTANGQLAGTNHIRPLHGGCVLHESWTSAAGNFSGDSLNAYDAARGVWHQTWTDSSGLLLQIEGKFENGAMTLRGERPAQQGTGTVLHQIQWTPNADGSVRQVWTTSGDEGETWQTLFDGLYVRKKD